MHDAGSGDEFVGRIALEVEASRLPGDCEIDWPYVQAVEDAYYFPIIEIDLNSAKLDQLRQFPQHNC